MGYKDPSQQKDSQTKYYESNKPLYRASVARVRRKKKVWIASKKAKPCTDCGVKYPYYVMQFDHVKGEKKFSLGGGNSSSTASYIQLEEEIAKCEVVCANCHAQRTWERLNQVPLV